MHYKVGLDDGSTMQFDSDRKLSDQELQGVVAQNHPKSLSFLKKAANFGIKEGIPLAGMVGGEALGAVGGAMAAPFTGGSSVPVGEVAGGGVGYGVGQEGSRYLQEKMGMAPKTSTMSKVRDFPKQAAIGAGYSLGGKLIGPAIKKGVPRLAEALTGVDRTEWARHAGDLKATLPEWLGGAKKPGVTGPAMGEAFQKSGVNPKSVEWPREAAGRTIGKIEKYVNTVESALKDPQADPKNVKTQFLIKAYKGTRKLISKAYESGDKDVALQWKPTKDLLKKEIVSRAGGDDIARSFAEHSRAKMAQNVSQILPGGKDFMIRRGLMPLVAYANPKYMGAMSPRLWSAGQIAGHAIPTSAAIGAAVDALKRKRNANSDLQP